MALQAMNEPDTSDVHKPQVSQPGIFLETTTDGCSSEAGNKMAETSAVEVEAEN